VPPVVVVTRGDEIGAPLAVDHVGHRAPNRGGKGSERVPVEVDHLVGEAEAAAGAAQRAGRLPLRSEGGELVEAHPVTNETSAQMAATGPMPAMTSDLVTGACSSEPSDRSSRAGGRSTAARFPATRAAPMASTR